MSSLSELMSVLMPSQEERAIFNLQEKEYTISRRPSKSDPHGKSSGISQGESGIIGGGTESSAGQVRESQEDLRQRGSEPTNK